MAEPDTTTLPTPIPTSLNVTALAKRFGVARTTIQRRLKKGWVPPAQPPRKPRRAAAPDAAPLPQHVQHGVGTTAIFAGAFWPVIGLGVAFELGKLSAVAWLGQRNGARTLRLACTALVAVLMVLNSIGVYGFLSRAHIEHALAGDLAVSGRTADIDARLQVQAGVVADLERRIAQVDAAVDKSISGGRTKAAMVLADQQRKNRAELVASRTTEAGKLAELRVQKAAVEGERKAVEADLGPVRYLATLIGSTDEQSMRWYILVVAMLLDPAAVLLLLAATRR